MNKGAICLAKASPPGVQKAYSEQFQRDLKVFLRSRSEELIPAGAMVLTFIISDQNHDDLSEGFELIACTQKISLDIKHNGTKRFMVQHMVEKRKLDSYNMSSYLPTAEEVRQVIEEEGSFNIQRMEKIIYDIVESAMKTGIHKDEDTLLLGERLTKTMRAATEPILKAEFGEEIMDELFTRFKSKIIQLSKVKKFQAANLVVYITKET